MNRRELFKNIGLAMVFGWASKPAALKRCGAMTVERHRRLGHLGIHLHVFHDGRDVTTRCSFADDTGEGVATLFKHNAQDRCYFDPETREVAKKTVDGVTFREGAPFA